MSKKIINEYLSAKEKGEKVSVPRVSFSQILLDWLPLKDFDYEVIDQKQPYLRCRVRGKNKSLVVFKRASGGGFFLQRQRGETRGPRFREAGVLA